MLDTAGNDPALRPADEPPRLYPTLRCRDATAMIRWLADVVGFTEQEVHRDGDRIVHAQLALGPSLLMLGDARDDDYGRQVGPLEGRRTDALYVATDDPDACASGCARRGRRS